MNANELRINNWVWLKSKSKAWHIGDGYEIDTGTDSGDFEPIPLTEEILLKCGTTSTVKGFHHQDRFSLRWLEAYKYWYVTDMETGAYITKVEFLHEWQNTWFVLQGTELTVTL